MRKHRGFYRKIANSLFLNDFSFYPFQKKIESPVSASLSDRFQHPENFQKAEK
ncbi:Uncharacterized protein ChrSV_0439 [Chromobacterium vaccinii]|nr:Uncharacterized protein ChrSW_0439 [Chromobacterium vaccinii]QND87898.1 Uncharacterized protein ChrSV_0439 [Chromobacterium vaccinii]